MTKKEKTIRWFEDIADECDKLTSGNVAHLRTQIRGMAIRSAEYLKKQEPASEDLKKEIEEYFALWYQGSTVEGCVNSESQLVSIYDCKRIAKHFAQWQKERMMKDAIEGKVVAVRTTMSDKSHTYPWIELEAQLSKNDKVKVIIIKE